ncbi:two-component system histidine kinase PnpS [Lentibacillus daqui]|uniref:two-component system histidine kinase PnpS n=1 Tax=Lentibacillus daqui TaxID=2911514 RepID=UPI0022B15C17|nr:ATP-binding protein [Lentibacillus daqui]
MIHHIVFQFMAILSGILLVLLLGAGIVLFLFSGHLLLVSVVLISTFLLFLFIGYFVIRNFAKPLDESVRMIKQFTAGNFSTRTYIDKPKSTGQLNRHLNELGESLQKTVKLSQIQQDQLETLIENIDSSLLLIDMDGHLRLANQTFQDMFHIKKGDWFHKNYQYVLHDEEVRNTIHESIVNETIVRQSVILPLGIERRYIDIYCAPIKHGSSHAKGIVVVLRDITELKKLEKVRKEFVANVSHELKTPVTSLKGFAETLLDEEMKDENIRKKFMTIILRESERLEALIYDLLELSKIESDTFQLNWQEVDLSKIVDETLELLQEEAKEKSIDIQSGAKGHTVIEGDPFRLKQMFINVITNAIVYSPEKGFIHVHVEGFPRTVEFIVKDNGIGISLDEIPRIFERFYRVDKARGRNSGGTGLGLAIVKHLTEAHNGRIDVRSEIGKGTTFKIIFPRSQE